MSGEIVTPYGDIGPLAASMLGKYLSGPPEPPIVVKPGLYATPSIHTDAQETASRPSAKIIMLGGAIKWWWQATCLTCGHWDEEPIMRGQRCPAAGHTRGHDLYVWWNSIEHRQYVRWRDKVRASLIVAGYLTYAPWMAFKGTWDERAQVVNDAVLSIADAMVVLSPKYAITEGTDEERRVAAKYSLPVIEAPPEGDGVSDDECLEGLLGMLGTL